MKTFLASGAIVFAVTALAAPASAKDEKLIIFNNTDQPIGNVTAKPGKVVNFRMVQPGSKKTFVLQMPDGVCDTTLTTVLPDGQSFRQAVEVCGGLEYTFGLAID